MADRVILIDGSAMIFRAFFAIPANFSTATGLHTNATYGFALMFRKLLAGRTPKFGAVIFDAPGKTFRDDKYPAYKAQRPRMASDLREQLAHIDKVVEVHRYPTYRIPGYEADDVIGTLARQAVAQGLEVHIVSGDKDFAQLIGDGIRMVDTMKDVTYDAELVRKKWGVPPEQFVDYLAILGDKVDNVPGVPGIGKKGASQLLEQFGTLEAILANTDQLKGRQKSTLQENAELARLSKDLVTIDCQVPLDFKVTDLVLPDPDEEAINALYKELEFFSLLSEEEAHSAQAMADEGDFGTLDNVESLEAFLAEAPEPISVMAIHEQPSFVTGDLVGFAFGVGPEKARYVPLAAVGDRGVSILRDFLGGDHPKVLHGCRDTITLLKRYDITLGGVVGDTQLASFLVDPTRLIPHKLPALAKQYLHRTLTPMKQVIGSGKSTKTFAEVPVEETSAWACHMAAAIWQIWPRVKRDLDNEGHTALMLEHEIPLSRVLAQMQSDGIRVDVGVLEGLEEGFNQRKAEVEQRIYELAGREFNVGSTKQLGAVLFDELGLPVIKRTKTGYSTNAEVLERLAPKHEIAQHILKQRALAKLVNTYTDVLKKSVNPATGRIHATFQQTTGASGRLITTDPDLQRTPIRTEDGKRIREAFHPKEGWVMISADWSQIELRILAHFTQDPELMAAFNERVDVHQRTASRIYDIEPDEVTPEQRNVGKTINFATIYGQGATALGQQLGIPRKEAKQIIDRYFERYAGVRSWLDQTIEDAKQNGYVTTIMGRRRYIPELSSNNFMDRGYGERIAGNTPIQGSAADICKLAMLQIAAKLQGMQTNMLVQIHDELLFECPPEELETAMAMIREVMENPIDLSVPLVVDMGHGKSWAEAH